MKIELISNGGDWEGLYIDGQLKTEGHSISVDEFAKILGLNFVERFVDPEFAIDEGCFPAKLSDIPSSYFV